jgi:hypothetical protein
MKKIFFIATFLLIISCSQDSINDLKKANNINIYLIKEGQLELHDSEIDLDALLLESSPWLKSTEIDFYDWSSHSFYLKNEKEKGHLGGRHFVVTSGNKRLFAGIFFPMLLSSLPALPSIFPEDGLFSPKDVIRFSPFGIYFTGGIEEKEDFKAELIAANLLREGIDVELAAITRINSSTLEYTFKVSNQEEENIYILDPAKMGNSRFHYYTNGVSLQQDNNYYWPQNFNPTASDFIKAEWYYKLLPGETITRTIELAAYDSLPKGKVKATFSFPGAQISETGLWKKSDGRIWLGHHVAEKELTIP